MRTSENSTAIDRAAAARSKSDEFSEVRMAVQMLGPILCMKPPNECCTFWDPDSAIVPPSLDNLFFACPRPVACSLLAPTLPPWSGHGLGHVPRPLGLCEVLGHLSMSRVALWLT